MTGFGTAAFGVQDRLLAIASQVAPRGWQIGFGLPAIRADLQVWVDEQIEDQDSDLLTTGELVAEESFRVHVYVYARRTGASAQDLRDLVAPVAAAIVDAINADPTLGDLVQMAWCAMTGYDGAFADPEGRVREAALRLSVRVAALLV